jgi:putative acetyltransferase
MSNLDPAILEAEDPASVESVRTLFAEYAVSLGFSLCFQNFDQELESLPGQYARPDGRLLLARIEDADIGCVALRKIGPQTCEMKRQLGFRAIAPYTPNPLDGALYMELDLV